MADVVGNAVTLAKVIKELIQKCSQRKENTHDMVNLRSFLKNLEHCCQQTKEKAATLRSNSAQLLLDDINKDLRKAISDAENLLDKGFVQSFWNAPKIHSKIEALQKNVLGSFQFKLVLAFFDVLIESQEKFKEALLEANKERDLISSTDISVVEKKNHELALREKNKGLLQILHIEPSGPQKVRRYEEQKNTKYEDAVSLMSSFRGETTTETEKFFADVLAAIGSASDGASSSSCPSRMSNRNRKWYQDPITYEVMYDPVKATDGYTYDRWTILNNPESMDKSPVTRRPFHIATDDLDVRGRLFARFRDQEAKFVGERAAYRNKALSKECLADAASMLRHVLQWASDDKECREKLQSVQRRMRSNACRDAGDTSTFPAIAQAQHLYPSRLDRARSNEFLSLSSDGLLCRYCSTAAAPEGPNQVAAALADRGVPVEQGELRRSETYFYFEISIQELQGAENKVVVGLGFAGLQSFQNYLLPGDYPKSCGYWGDQGYIFADGSKQSLTNGGEAHLPIAKEGDTLGAGIHHAHKEIFFVHNGALIAVIPNTLLGPVMPVVALGSPGACVEVAFNGSAFHPERSPCRMVISHSNVQQSIVSLSSDGLNIAQSVSPFHANEDIPVVSLQADYSASFRHPYQMYYFELTIVKKGAPGSTIAIGFAHQKDFQADQLPGWYPSSCAYHIGDDGSLYFGRPDTAQNFGPPTFSCIEDTIGAGIDHASGTIFFIKNGKKVGHTRRLRMSCALHPVIGLRGQDVEVSLNFKPAPAYGLELDIIEQPTRLNPPSSPLETCVSLSADGLEAQYIANRKTQFHGVAALMADRAICRSSKTQTYYFELTVDKIRSGGQDRYITIGFCNQDHFRCIEQPGMYESSCGYRGDGILFVGNPSSCPTELLNDPTCRFSKGDVVGAGLDLSKSTIFFTKNGRLVGPPSDHILALSYAVCPIIGLNGKDQKVSLNFGQYEFSFDTSTVST